MNGNVILDLHQFSELHNLYILYLTIILNCFPASLLQNGELNAISYFTGSSTNSIDFWYAAA